MASIHRRGQGWLVRYRDPDTGKNRGKSFRTEREAKDFRSDIEARINRGEWINPDKGRMTVQQWSDIWLKSKEQLAGNTVGRHRSSLQAWILPALGKRPLAKVKPVDVNTVLADAVKAGRAPNTVRNIYATAASMFADAVANRLIPRSPCDEVGKPASIRLRDIRPLTPREVEKIANEMDERYGIVVLFLAWTGLRPSEAWALAVRDIDLDRRTVHVTKAYGSDGRLKGPKTGMKGVRTVGIPAALTQPLRQHMKPLSADDRLFTTRRGGRISKDNFRQRQWKPACRRAGIGGVTIYDLRHTCASWLIRQGVDPKALQTWMGHTNISQTYDTYGHLFPGHTADLTDRLDALDDIGGDYADEGDDDERET